MNKIITTLIIALIGGFIGNKLKIPAGALIGSMVSVGIFNLFSFKLEIPQFYRIVAHSILGGSLGLLITKDFLMDLRKYLIPSLTVVILLSLFGALTGIIVSKITKTDILTSLFGSVPGGMQEMIVLSDSYDVNHVEVVVMQTVRRILIVVLYPLLVNIIMKFINIPLNIIK
ncbi:AbrB family transcriptional regulator [Sporanaerobacter acetigenes]|uniref:AbrB family transcriptional regulator n=1 Tax=Sporanaerobacter acetigenes TaxID=165813 RepID=UPI00104B0F1C|nr:AbrB family transcriptional regulator [Sporanaerobacter acetigenes]